MFSKLFVLALLVAVAIAVPPLSKKWDVFRAAPSNGSDPMINLTIWAAPGANGVITNYSLAAIANPIGHFHAYVWPNPKDKCGGGTR